MSNEEGYCYCKIGAGGPPCVDRATCDERGGTQQYVDRWRKNGAFLDKPATQEEKADE